MNTQLCSNRDQLVAKINGQLAFLDVALMALKQADIGNKVLTQMHRGVTAIRSTLRQANSPELEAFVCDFEDLLSLLGNKELAFTPQMIELVRHSTKALRCGVQAVQCGGSVSDAVQGARDAVFSVLLDHAVTVKR